MENENYEISDYSFLAEERIEKHFADINMLLLSGKHIDHKYYVEYTVLESYEPQWSSFYSNLYRLNLVADISDGSRYYYLDFTENGKGKLSDASRNKELTELQTLIGLTLLDMYYQKYFDEEKVIYWNDIKTQILESDHQEAYKRILFNDIRASYDEKEWNEVHTKFSKTIENFDRLGWVEKQSGRNEDLVFEIRPAIHRLAKLYQEELQDFGSFSQQLKNDEAP
ncbi:condensin complex protein MksE [Pedobacter punctiformis]|uniref:DUF4194 domain-containing protein n=1 Tax=Pedobacter punctiformis TaxID=3004097 RepID=A0ABT4LB43_9SPHI|nr:hypothetical protein [Pedobacter sp. HCMS5-2]MCZ4245140.1 hypothetical protein [Pedobacter sp. HCMS5-2]